MSGPILNSVLRDTALLRWLHSHDPDRNFSEEILSSCATYSSFVVADPSAPQLPPTHSFFVPMYNRSHFVLGQLYGPMSPNSMALNMLAQAGYGSPPQPISRRFVVDLSFRTSLQFIEYEWFSDGKLCISTHNIDSMGHYNGSSVLMDIPSKAKAEHKLQLKREDLVEGTTVRPHACEVIMNLSFTEKPNLCSVCGVNSTKCSCVLPKKENVAVTKPVFDPPTDWMSWLGAFGRSRAGLANMSLRFSMVTPMGNMEGSQEVKLQQECELGVESSSRGNMLLKMFMDSAGMLVSHPSADNLVLSAEEKRDRIELANELSEDENWAEPREFTIEMNGIVTDSFSTAPTGNYQSPTKTNGIMSKRSSQRGVSISSSRGMFRDAGSKQVNGVQKGPANTFQLTLRELGGPAVPLSPPRQDSSETALETTPGVQGESRVTKRRGRHSGKLFACDCGKVFTHRGHYNEHRLCVHEKVREHRCLYLNCKSRFFKRSDRDRHMRSKHDSSTLVCSACTATFPDKGSLDLHCSQEHAKKGKFACSNCSLTYETAKALRGHLPKCRMVK